MMARIVCIACLLALAPLRARAQDSPAADRTAELAAIDARLAELGRMRHRGDAGIAVLLTGGLAGVIAAPTAALWWLTLNAKWEGKAPKEKLRPVRRLGWTSVGLLSLGAAGLTWAVVRHRADRPLRAETRQLRARRRELLPDVEVGPSGARLSLQLRF